MLRLLESIESVFQLVVQYGVLLMECVGVVILLVTTAKSIWGCLRRDPHVRLTLAKGIALAREFKLAILGAIIVLRGALMFLIHWEIKTEEANLA